MAVVPAPHCLDNLFSYVVKQFVLLSHITQRERFSACLSSGWQMVLLWRDVSSLVWFWRFLGGYKWDGCNRSTFGAKRGYGVDFLLIGYLFVFLWANMPTIPGGNWRGPISLV